MSKSRAHILVLSYPSGLAWVLTESQMGWQESSAHMGKGIQRGDRLYIYASRAAAPTLRGAIIGAATAVDALRAFDSPKPVDGRSLTHGLPLDIEMLVDPHATVTLGALVPELPALDYARNRRAWTGHLQRGLVPLGQADEVALDRALVPASDIDAARREYVRLARVAARSQ